MFYLYPREKGCLLLSSYQENRSQKALLFSRLTTRAMALQKKSEEAITKDEKDENFLTEEEVTVYEKIKLQR